MKTLALFFSLFLAIIASGCAQNIADSMYSDQYLKPISKSRKISSQSQKAAVNAAVSAAGKTQWTPKTISVETGYVLAEQVPSVKAMDSGRDYAFKLEVRLPASGKGDVTIVITPPQGLTSSVTMEEVANKYLDALDRELKTKK